MQQHQSPRIYVWDVANGDGSARSGVTGDPDTAITDVGDALAAAAPTASGTVRRVCLSPMGRPEYIDLDRIAEAHREGTSVIWRLR